MFFSRTREQRFRSQVSISMRREPSMERTAALAAIPRAIAQAPWPAPRNAMVRKGRAMHHPMPFTSVYSKAFARKRVLARTGSVKSHSRLWETAPRSWFCIPRPVKRRQTARRMRTSPTPRAIAPAFAGVVQTRLPRPVNRGSSRGKKPEVPFSLKASTSRRARAWRPSRSSLSSYRWGHLRDSSRASRRRSRPSASRPTSCASASWSSVNARRLTAMEPAGGSVRSSRDASLPRKLPERKKPFQRNITARKARKIHPPPLFRGVAARATGPSGMGRFFRRSRLEKRFNHRLTPMRASTQISRTPPAGRGVIPRLPTRRR